MALISKSDFFIGIRFVLQNYGIGVSHATLCPVAGADIVRIDRIFHNIDRIGHVAPTIAASEIFANFGAMKLSTDRNYIYELTIKVRDYEVDAEGIVNNAVYLNYMEHTRHEFCEHAGMSFRRMCERRIYPVLRSVQIEYLHPLTLGDTAVSRLGMTRRGPLFIFTQDIYLADGTPVARADIAVATLEDGRLTRGEVLAEAFKEYLQ